MPPAAARATKPGRRQLELVVFFTGEDFLSLLDASPDELVELPELEPESADEPFLDSEADFDAPFAPFAPFASADEDSLPELTVLELFLLSVR